VASDADLVCFGTYTDVPDDPNLRASAGQGRSSVYPNYDSSIPHFSDSDSQAWRSDSPARSNNGPNAVHGGAFGVQLDVVPEAWYRLPAERALATTPPGGYHCNTMYTGWLSGWGGAVGDAPDGEYAVPADGSLPPAVGLPPVAGTVCIDSGYGNTCSHSIAVQAVDCGAFALWQLPATDCNYCGYCLAA
jgi:hypothetical protein